MTAAGQGAWRRLATRWRGVVITLVGVPLAVTSLQASLAWFQRPFPGFLVMENGVIASVAGIDWPSEKERLFHARVEAVDGEPVRDSAAIYARVATRPAGTTFAYTVRKGDHSATIEQASRAFSARDWFQVYGILLLVGVLNLGTAIAVAFLQPGSRPARVYVTATFIGATFALLPPFLHEAGYPLLTRTYFLAETLFGAAFIHMALVFPEDRLAGRRRVWALLPWGLGIVLTLWKLHDFFAEPPDLTALHVTYLFIASGFIVFVASAVTAYRHSADPSVRPRLRTVLFGVLAGSSLATAVFIDNAIAGGRVPMQFGVVLVPVFFGSVAYAIVKHDLFHADRLARQGFVYGTLSLIVLAVYGLTLLLSARLLPQLATSLRIPLGISCLLLFALALDPLRRLAQQLVDRTFYRARLHYRPTIDRLSAMLSTILETPEVVSQVTVVVADAMQLDSAAICLFGEGDEEPVIWIRDARGRLVRRLAEPALARLGEALAGAGRDGATMMARLGDPALGAEARATLDAWRAQLALPLRIRDRTIGLLLLGTHRSGHALDSDDVALLRTLAHQTAIALHNARSYERLATLTRDLDAQVRAQTDELRASNARLVAAYDELQRAQSQLVHSEKMTSLGRLVAGVAHELNNPASFVHGSLQNLAEYVEAFTRALRAYQTASGADPDARDRLDAALAEEGLEYLLREAPQLIRICQEGSQRIVDIVADLRTFARPGESARIAVDVRAGIESTLRLLQPRLAARAIALTRDYQDAPRLMATPGELNQAWMNLISNAIDAVEGRRNPEIRIGIRPGATAGDGEGGSWVEIAISDNGTGIEAQHLPHVFEPFFTTKPTGVGTGLGLSITYGAVRSHGGEIDVQSVVGVGTVFTVRLPATPEPASTG